MNFEKYIKIRRELHKTPEIAFSEVNTSKVVQKTLSEMGISSTIVAKTGVIALIGDASKGKTVLLRADMDALPIEEETQVEYKSQVCSMMHACGHDVHTACLLGAAQILKEKETELNGCVKLVFQPAEEGVGGALPMINENVMENPKVDAAFALHVEPLAEVGTVQIKNGAIMASPDDFFLTIKGKGGHGAYPHTCIDPISIGSQVVMAYQTIVSRHQDPMVPAVVSVCSFNAGSCTNAIPDVAYLTGTARSLDIDTRNSLKKQLEDIADGIITAMGGTYEFQFKPLYPPTINDIEMTSVVANVAEEIDGVNKVEWLEKASMGGEDFAYFAQKVPASYFKLGCGNEKKGIVHPIHSPKFDVDESCIPIGIQLLANVAMKYLG